MNRQDQNRWIIAAAQFDGDRIVLLADPKPKQLWAGLGNRSGLHSYIPIAISEKWNKSGARFTKKLNELPAGSVVQIHAFRNIDRDRGRWIPIHTFTLV